MQIVYDEQYGYLSVRQQEVYRKNNVSPLDHDDLVDHFDSSAHNIIADFVEQCSWHGQYIAPLRWVED